MADREQPWESDAELVEEILAGSMDHFNLLYAAYFPRVYRFALKRLRDPGEAEDVTQEVFLTVFRVLSNYRGDSASHWSEPRWSSVRDHHRGRTGDSRVEVE